MFNLIAVCILAFSGIFFGKALRKIAFEEVKLGEKYLIYLQYSLLFILSMLLAYYSEISYEYLFLFILGFFSTFFIKKRYLHLGLILYVSLFSQELLVLTSSIIFIYGLSFGSLAKKVLPNIVYFVIGFILVFILTYIGIPIENSSLLSFLAGSIFLRY